MRRVGRRRLVPLRQPFAPPRGAPLVEEDPPADPHDPGGIAALSPVVAGALPGADEGLLRQIVGIAARDPRQKGARSEEHTSELQSLMRTSYAVFCLKKKTKTPQ